MSEQSNNQGRAYEYICVLTLCEEIQKLRPAKFQINSALNVLVEIRFPWHDHQHRAFR